MALLGWVPGLEAATATTAADGSATADASTDASSASAAAAAASEVGTGDHAIAGAGAGADNGDGMLQPRFIHNASGRFESRWAAVRVERDTRCVLLRGMQGAGTHAFKQQRTKS